MTGARVRTEQSVGYQTVAIELSPGRLDVALTARGKFVRGVGVLLDPNEWSGAWSDGLRPLDGRLATLLRELGVREGARADVVHRGPDVAAEVYALPMKRGQAVNAARLALADAVMYPLDEATTYAGVICADRSGDARQTHTLACADTEGGAQTIVDWLGRAGLKAGSVVSGEALCLSAAVREAVGEASTAVVRLGDRSSVIAAGARGRLSFVRQTDIGVQHMVEALTRPLKRGVDEVRLTREEASELLFRVGVPEDGNGVVDARRGLRASDVMPALQPVLQRLLVDLKQSLRFGLDERDAAETAILLVGPGSAVPRLDELLAENTGLRVEARPLGTGNEAAGACPADGDLRCALREGWGVGALLPASERSLRAVGAMKRGMLLGAVAGLGIVLTSAWGGWSALGEARKARTAAVAAAEHAEELIERKQTSDTLSTEVARVEAAVVAKLGERADWEAALLELARLTPEDVWLTDVRGEYDEETPVLRLRGYVASSGTGEASREALTAFFATLGASPLVERSELGATQRSDLDGRPAMHFDGVLELVRAPVAHGALVGAARGAGAGGGS